MVWGCCGDTPVLVEPMLRAVITEDKVVRSSNFSIKVPLVSVPEYLEAVCRHFGPKTAFIDAVTGSATSYSELWENVQNFATAIQHHGLLPGQFVCFHCVNHVEFWFAFLGVALAGGALVMAKASLTPKELQYQLEDSKPTYIITEPGLLEKVSQAKEHLEGVKELILFSESEGYATVTSLLQEGQKLTFERPERTDPRSTPLSVLYSSGTTGLPKGVISSHYNFLSQMLQAGQDGEPFCNYTDVIVQWLPCTHLSGVFFTLVSLGQGATLLVLPSFKLDLLFASIQKYQGTFLPLFPTFANMLTQSPLWPQYNLSSVRTVGVGGSVTPAVVVERLSKVFNLETLFHVYGMTEASGMVTMSATGQTTLETVGCPLPMTEIKIIDLFSGEPLGPNEEGEILCRGPQIMMEYLNKPQATASAIDSDGWYRTGDVGHYDAQGQFYITDRVKDLIKCMDQQVAPAELEDLLMTHPNVRHVAVAGVPHEGYGEAPRAFVVLKDTEDVSLEGVTRQLQELISENLAFHKHLHGGVEFMEELPKSDTGKFLRRRLRDVYVARTRGASG
ncbi:uncharacterized protein LOC135398666 [Ornithodoros turicata]|uniref:uncharacterized protein LOC135398666 n=1 Tax=Ornithodoros turicata TaxID=34597 RepID=UPI003138DCD0